MDFYRAMLCRAWLCQQQQHLFTKHRENTMMEGQQAMKSSYGHPQQKREKKMNNLNNQNPALKSVHLASLYL